MVRAYRRRRKEDRILELKTKFDKLEARKNKVLANVVTEGAKVGKLADRQQTITNKLSAMGVAYLGEARVG